MPFFQKLWRGLNSELVRHTAMLAVSYGSRLGIQAAYFVIIARTLGIERYGLFVGLVALAGAVVPFTTWGSEYILVKRVSRDRTRFPEALGVSISLSLMSSLILTLICMGIGRATLPEATPTLAIAAVLVSDLVAKSIHTQAFKAFLAVNDVKVSAFLINLGSLKNLLAALVLLLVPLPGDRLVNWSLLYAGSTMLAACISMGLAMVRIGKPLFSLSHLQSFEYREGFYFSINQSASSLNANLDKTMLASMAPLGGAGIYAAAYRIIEISTVPIRALMTAAYSKFFKRGAQGVSGAMTFARKVLRLSGSYGLLIAIVIPFIAPVVPLILGEEYRDAVEAMRWLAPMTILLGLRFPVADVLSSTNNQGIRSAVQVTTALVNFGINLVLIPLLSWKGAAIATLISDGLQTAVLWGVLLWLLRSSDRAPHTSKELP